MKKIFLIASLFILPTVYGQAAYKLGETVENFALPVILNNSRPQGELKDLKSDLTILDFFGTWCVPCIKALPTLAKLEEKFPGKLKVILISTESQLRLQKFIANRKEFGFPLVVDSNSVISGLFNPPSYPYTVVINRNNKIVSITEAGLISDIEVASWLAGNNAGAKLPPLDEKQPAPKTTIMNNDRSANPLVALSQDFMYAAKTGEGGELYERKMQELSFDSLQAGLSNENEKKAFWINAYNAYTQIILKRDPGAYKNRRKFFTSRQIKLAGLELSLDDIEHNILRRGKVKWSLGYFNKLFPGKTMRALRVKKLDFRIHFALNCGASSCPPIAFYNPQTLDAQLDLATAAYLKSEAKYDIKENSIGLPAIMSWFRGDFGGKKGMLKLLKQKGIIAEGKKPSIYFNPYNWELALSNYAK